MATAEKTTVKTDIAEPTTVKRWSFTVDEYYRMAGAGIFHEDSRVELIDGDIIAMSPIGVPHASSVDRLTKLLNNQLGDRANLRIQGPVRLGEHSEPIPDLAILKPKPDFYASGHPGPSDVFFLVEVMDTSADRDRGKKLALYARSEIAELWLLDLNRELVECYRRPIGEIYTEHRVLPRGQSLAPEAFPDVVLGVDAILG